MKSKQESLGMASRQAISNTKILLVCPHSLLLLSLFPAWNTVMTRRGSQHLATMRLKGTVWEWSTKREAACFAAGVMGCPVLQNFILFQKNKLLSCSSNCLSRFLLINQVTFTFTITFPIIFILQWVDCVLDSLFLYFIVYHPKPFLAIGRLYINQ